MTRIDPLPTVDDRRHLRRRVSLVLHRQAPARGGARQLAARDGAARRPLVRWHPFELNPDLPREGIDRRAYLEAKFGGAQRAARNLRARARGRRDRSASASRSSASRGSRTRATRTGSSRGRRARRRGRAGRAAFHRVFPRRARSSAIAPCSRRSRARRASTPRPRARCWIRARATSSVLASERRALEIGIGGVPFFIFDGRVAVSGAQDRRSPTRSPRRAHLTRAERRVRTPGPTAATA